MKITRAEGGTAEREVDVKDIKVPDLWHLYQHLKTTAKGTLADKEAEAVHETWQLAHDLLKNLQRLSEEENGEANG